MRAWFELAPNLCTRRKGEINWFPKKVILIAVLTMESKHPGQYNINRCNTVQLRVNPRGDFDNKDFDEY